MSQITIGYSVNGGGLSIPRSVQREVDGQDSRGPITLAAGKAGTLSTRTDDNTGTLTLGGGHGITTGMIVDLYWTGGMRYDVTVGTVSGNSVPFDLGAGDNLPIATTAIVCAPRTLINAAIDGDALAVLAVEVGYTLPNSTGKGHVEFQDAADDTIAELDLVANSPQVFDVTGTGTNPFTGDPITKIYASNGSSTEAATLKLIWGSDNTP